MVISQGIAYGGRRLSASVLSREDGDRVVVRKKRRWWFDKTITLSPFQDLQGMGAAYRSRHVAGLSFEVHGNSIELIVRFEGYHAGEHALVGYPYRV